MSVRLVPWTGMLVTWTFALTGPVGAAVQTVGTECNSFQVKPSGSSPATECIEALEKDVQWVRKYLNARKADATDKAERDKRLAHRITELQAKGGSFETMEGAFTAARDLLDLAFRLKAVAVEDKLTATLDRISHAEAPLQRLTQALSDRGQEADQAPLSDKQVIADLKLATERILAEAQRLQPEVPLQGAHACDSSKVWCFGIVGSGTQEQEKGERRVTNARIYLVDAYTASKQLRCFGDQTCRIAAKNLTRTLRDVLDEEGLRPMVAALVKPGLGFGKTNDEKKAVESLAVRFATRTQGVGQLSLGLVGHFGLEPALDLLKTEPTSDFSDKQTRIVQVARDGTFTVRSELSRLDLRKCPADKADKPAEWSECPLLDADVAVHTPTLQRAFVWDVGGRASVSPSELVAFSAVGRVGMTMRTTEFAATEAKAATADKPAESPALVGQLVGEQGDSNWYYELGLQFQIFDRTLGTREAAELGLRRSVLLLEAGYRWDRRFRNNVVLKAAPDTYGERPQERWYFRFALDRVPVFVDGGKEGGKPDIFLSFSIEHEGRRRALGLPSTTRVFVQGNLGFKL